MNQEFEKKFLDYFVKNPQADKDGSHDVDHFSRVAKNSLKIASRIDQETDALVLLAASYFHDIVNLPKNHPDRKMSSRYSAKKAEEILKVLQFPTEKIPLVCHAIETHSFSADLRPKTLEAKILQDADRLESLGTLGIMRVFYVSGLLQREPYDPDDLFAENRPLDDKAYGLDHFYCKLFKLPGMMQTEPGKEMSQDLVSYMRLFVKQLTQDLKNGTGDTVKIVDCCYEGGKNTLKLFDSKDPLARSRPLQKEHFVLDSIIGTVGQAPFIDHFVQHLC